MDPQTRAAVALILAQSFRLSHERDLSEQERMAAEQQVALWDARLNECWVALRVFGIDVHAPGAWDELVKEFWPEIEATQNRESDDGIPARPADDDLTPAAVRSPQPLKIGKLVRDYLRQAGPQGARAAEIRAHVENACGRRVHEKTVGMTLYRLSKKIPPTVRRDGQVWFLVPETEASSTARGQN